MIPAAEAIVAGHRFVARRFGVRAPAHEPSVRAALELARSLTTHEADEPAALFFAFARYPLAFPALRTRMTDLLVLNSARRLGQTLRVTERDLRALYVPIATGELPFEQVREWFGARLG